MGDEERRIYMQSSFHETFNVDVHDLNIVIALFNEASRETVNRSWIGILIVSLISIDSVLVYFIFGSLIIIKIYKNDLTMNKKTRYLQKQLMKALAVQSSIPMLVSFLPCLFAWYFPVFNVNVGQWIFWFSSVAISFFPVLDPLALFFFIPAFRKRIVEILRVGNVQLAISSISGKTSKTSQTSRG
uniref:G protein-coupled receptor n=1 Tax=Caenorhabditis japonica TaxID=281687 RepID=A0A8R1DIC1_CAEJA